MNVIRLLLLFLLISCNNFPKKESIKIASKKEVSSIQKIDSVKLIDTLKLYNKRLVGEVILSKNKWHIVSGRSCTQCDENISIFLFPENPEFIKSKNPIKNTDRFSYPGKVFYYEDNSLIYESSTFFGKCLDDFENVIVWVDKGLTDSNEWEESIYMIQLFNDKTIDDVKPELKLSLLEQIDKHIAEGKCFEIEAIDQTSEP